MRRPARMVAILNARSVAARAIPIIVKSLRSAPRSHSQTKVMTVKFPALPAALLGAYSLWLSSSAMAQQAALDELSLEDLLEVKVLTIARKAQRISDIPAAVTVVTAEDIRRSGARSIPDALRQVPGVEVAQVGAGRYAVSIRGFNGRFANALLVQLDGRSIYSPLLLMRE